MILYIHGFRSTAHSAKSVLIKEHFGEATHIADFSHVPDQAIDDLEKIMAQQTITGLMASSLGCFYATYLAEKYQLKAVLINPSTRPYETLERYLGKNETHDGLFFDWKREHLTQLEQYCVEYPTVKNYAIFLKKGDSILDYKVAEQYYQGSQIWIEEGGTHSFEDFDKHLESVDQFFNNNNY